MALTLVRLAVLYVESVPEGLKEVGFRQGECEVRIDREQELDERRQLTCGGAKHRLLLAAYRKLEEFPTTSEDGHLEIPEQARTECERALETYARTLSVCIHSPFGLASPWPPIVLIPETDEERKRLNETAGLRYGAQHHSEHHVPIPFNADTLEQLQDRMDGVFLLSEAIRHGYLDYVRLFERAFRASGKRLGDLLYAFLQTSGRSYTRDTVRRWTKYLRDARVHADREKPYKAQYHVDSGMTFALSAQVGQYAGAIREAAYDVLFNKKEWGTSCSSRRSGLGFIPVSSDETGNPLIYRGLPVSVKVHMADAYGVFAADPDTVLNVEQLSDSVWSQPEVDGAPRVRPAVEHPGQVTVLDNPMDEPAAD